MAHRCGFTKNVLANTLAAAGFTVGVKARSQEFDLWAVGLKASSASMDRLKQLCSSYFFNIYCCCLDKHEIRLLKSVYCLILFPSSALLH